MDIHFPDSLEPDEEEDTPINGGDVVWYPPKKKNSFYDRSGGANLPGTSRESGRTGARRW